LSAKEAFPEAQLSVVESSRMASGLARLMPSQAVSIFFGFEKVKPDEGDFRHFPVDQRLETNFWLGSGS
jgi:hypothetical protein